MEGWLIAVIAASATAVASLLILGTACSIQRQKRKEKDANYYLDETQRARARDALHALRVVKKTTAPNPPISNAPPVAPVQQQPRPVEVVPPTPNYVLCSACFPNKTAYQGCSSSVLACHQRTCCSCAPHGVSTATYQLRCSVPVNPSIISPTMPCVTVMGAVQPQINHPVQYVTTMAQPLQQAAGGRCYYV